MNFIPNTDEDRKSMLKEIGIETISGLFSDIPSKLLLNENLNIPKGLSEPELKLLLKQISKKNNVDFSYFLGAGAYNHFIPSVVNHIISRSEFYTAYTPYQPEISQGMLQAIYEYQSMICSLTGMDVANASMYDGASALAESCIMASNITRKRKILISRAVHPHYREVVQTYCKAHGFSLSEVDIKEGVTSIDKLKESISDDTAAFLVQSPNFLGCIEDLDQIEGIVHSSKALLNVCVTDPTSLGILKSPGAFKADIVVGEGQSFGNSISFGGPYLGMMAAKKEYVRQMPGRIVGATLDKDGKKGYILNLQAREQHIRREKASSNICSNEALNALAATVYLSAMGKDGLKKVSRLCLQKAHYLSDSLNKIGIQTIFSSPFYNEFAVKVNDAEKANSELLKNRIIGGLSLGKYYPELDNCLLFCVTEMNTKEEMDKVVGILKNEADL
ncbi:aminomethyl-transferring glycine dehydrogenase subunit GcvPA [Candidatus Woesearchaeota archaeon]|nr:aminomethyl-transferring glycine dehydrogenase subunit GcvPA [Candidatus Woesearchaeota archaeon]